MSLEIVNQLVDGDDEDGSGVMEVVVSNEDLLLQFLHLLPPRSLLRFKSVSKYWLSLISSTQFRRLWSKRVCKNISGLLLRRNYKPYPEYEFVTLLEGENPPFQRLDFGDDEAGLDAVQYCNGLLLCKSKTSFPYAKKADRKYHVINPTTKDCTTVSVKESSDVNGICSVNLAFDPRKSPHFKLICLYWSPSLQWYPDDVCFRTYIYSSETGLMTQIGHTFHTKADLVTTGLYWNGAINWISYTLHGFYFNVDEERFGILPMPPVPHGMLGNAHTGEDHRWIRYYGESSDHLHYIQIECTPTAQFHVYEMDKGYSGWFRKFNVDLLPVFKSYPEAINAERHPLHIRRYSFSILSVVDRDDGENPFLVLSIPGKAIRFDLKDKGFTKLCDLATVNDLGRALPLYTWDDSFQFIESLHPL